MSDRIIVMSAGRIEQVGAPEEVYNNPASEFVANFLGASNIVAVDVKGRGADDVTLEVPHFGAVTLHANRAVNLGDAAKGKLVIRAEKLHLSDGAAPEGAVSTKGVVEAVDYQGQLARYFVRIGDTQFQAMNMIDGAPFAQGAEVSVVLNPDDCSVLANEA